MILRALLLSITWLLAAPMAVLAAESGDPVSDSPMVVYKSPSCGCCAKWVDYLRDNGFAVQVHDRKDLNAIKRQFGVSGRLASCHTAVVGGYVIEGHVPVADIRKLLAERPDVTGLTAPGMPQFSPGMRSLTPRDYDVLSFDSDGRVELFSRY